MKKLLGVSIAAMLAVTPMVASADVASQVTLMTAPGESAQTAGGKTLPSITGNTQIATTSYVTGAYNALGAAHNVVEGRVTDAEAAIDLLNDADDVEGSVAYAVKENAESADYTNTTSGLTATTIKDAIDELAATVDNAGANSTVSNANYVRQGNSVADNLTNLDSAAKANSEAVAAILSSEIPVFSTWGSDQATQGVTVASLQGASATQPAANVTADTTHEP